MKFLLVNILILSVLSTALCDDNSTTPAVITSTLATSTAAPTTTTTATPTTTTSSPATTTPTPEPKKEILQFRVPKNLNETACLKANMSLDFNFTYLAEVDGKKVNSTVVINLDKVDDYTGVCGNNSYNTLEISFNNGWTLVLNYTLSSSTTNPTYELNLVNLTYSVDNTRFPNASETGLRNAVKTNLTEFLAYKGNAYKCVSLTDVMLNDFATVMFSNYLAQPFLSNQELGTASECAADTTGTSKLVPIIVGSALAILVVLVLVAYIIGRRKHKPGYQQV